MAKKNTKKSNIKTNVNKTLEHNIVDTNTEDVNAGVSSVNVDKEVLTERLQNSDFITIDGQNEYINFIHNDTNVDALKYEPVFMELYGMKKCIDILNKHYSNLREMNVGYDIPSYCEAKHKLSELKEKEELLLKVIENKIFNTVLE